MEWKLCIKIGKFQGLEEGGNIFSVTAQVLDVNYDVIIQRFDFVSLISLFSQPASWNVEKTYFQAYGNSIVFATFKALMKNFGSLWNIIRSVLFIDKKVSQRL